MRALTQSMAACFAAAVLVGTMAGCGSEPETIGAENEKEKPATTQESQAPAEDEAGTSDETDTDEAEPTEDAGESEAAEAGGAPGDVKTLAPGEKTSGWGAVEFVNHDEKTAVFAHKLVKIEKAPKADMDQLVEKAPKAKGMQMYYLRIESHYVSGDALAFASFSTSFDPVDDSGDKVQSVGLIGWDNCKSNSIPKPGDDPSATIENCVAALAVPGGQVPTGVQWAQYDTDYASYQGKPAYFYVK